MRSFSRMLIHTQTQTQTHSLTHSFTHSLTHSLTHTHTHTHTHTLSVLVVWFVFVFFSFCPPTSVCLSIFLFVCLPDCLSVYLSSCLPACLSICLSFCLPVCLSVCSACQSICLSWVLTAHQVPLVSWTNWFPEQSCYCTLDIYKAKVEKMLVCTSAFQVSCDVLHPRPHQHCCCF